MVLVGNGDDGGSGDPGRGDDDESAQDQRTKAIVSAETATILSGLGSGPLDVRIKRLADERDDLQVRHSNDLNADDQYLQGMHCSLFSSRILFVASSWTWRKREAGIQDWSARPSRRRRRTGRLRSWSTTTNSRCRRQSKISTLCRQM